MTEQETFVTRMRRHRERSRISLASISRDTRVKLELLEALERNDLSAWPRGLYARAYIRSYASAIGLDGGETVGEFCRLFPHGDRRAEPIIREIAAIVAAQSAYEYDFRYATETDRRQAAGGEVMPRPRWWEPRALGSRMAGMLQVLGVRIKPVAERPEPNFNRLQHP
jgi:hypothetical protein